MIINVTQSHINNGIRESCHKCAIALALNDALDNKYYLLVEDVIHISGLNYNSWITRKINSKIADFIFDFDQGKKVKPFSFNLRDLPRGFN